MLSFFSFFFLFLGPQMQDKFLLWVWRKFKECIWVFMQRKRWRLLSSLLCNHLWTHSNFYSFRSFRRCDLWNLLCYKAGIILKCLHRIMAWYTVHIINTERFYFSFLFFFPPPRNRYFNRGCHWGIAKKPSPSLVVLG